MKMIILLMTTCLLQVSASSFAQKLTYRKKGASLEEIFKEIRTQTDYNVFYLDKKIDDTRRLDVNFKNTELKQVLDQLKDDLELTYTIDEKNILIKPKTRSVVDVTLNVVHDLFNNMDIRGKVIDEQGKPLVGATVLVKNGGRTATNSSGEFILTNVHENDLLEVSFIGYINKEVKASPGLIIVQLELDNSKLNEVQVIGYGTTTKRLNTGSVSTITSEELEKQPVTNVLSALSGRAPGVFVQTTNGLPGGNINIQIRGKGSILAGTDPLYIIDGIPFSSTIVPNNVVTSGSIIGVNSPLNTLNPADIESITILKDADATAIYGSRGTNGVILITTKKGKAGKTKFNAKISNGITKIASYPNLLNLAQYLQIRREAYANDGLTPSKDATSNTYAPDLTVWDGTNSTDWTRLLFGGTGHATDAQVGISGGASNTSFNVSGNYHGESTVLPAANLYQRGGLHFNLQHKSLNNKFSLLLSSLYISDNNMIANPVNGISADIFLPPNYPVYDATGAYNWYVDNPVAALQSTSKTKTDNLVTDLTLGYSLYKGLNVKLSGGYNKISNNQTEIFPTSALNPNGYTNPYYGSTNYSEFGTSSNQTFIIEPQLDFHKDFKNSSLAVLLGGTYQNSIFQNQSLVANNFTSQGLMYNLGSAGILSNQSSTYTQYKYASVFGRITYNFDQKYIINGTIRRDGSSRFAPGNQFGNFGSIGAAWIFSSEPFVKDHLPFLSFGKLRSSYGLTGNDQISDYQYLSTYSSLSAYNYQGIAALRPSRIANSDFHWETTRKLEFALELGMFKDRIQLNINRYQNDSHDQLVNYQLPRETGFPSYQANLPAIVENKGWEFELHTKNIQAPSFSWTTTFNITLPKNKLKSFDNFSTSSYAKTLQLGYDITRIYGYQFLGVDPATGTSSYAPEPGSTSTAPYQYFTIGKQTPDFYGGFGNTFSYKSWKLDIFGQFAKQMAKGGLVTRPGAANNSFIFLLNRWQKPGDQTDIPKASTVADSYYANTSANFFNASYFRLKNVALSYDLPGSWLRKFKLDQVNIYVQGENLYTWWNKKSGLMDPESGALTNAAKNIPPMKTITAGMQVNF